VIGWEERGKGQDVAAFVRREGTGGGAVLQKESVPPVRDQIGPIATLRILNIVPQAPQDPLREGDAQRAARPVRGEVPG
jgi:acyl-coenzyme A synthetase/AMP-(fatty) acid ligase